MAFVALQKKYSSDKKWNAKTVKWWALPKPFINAWMLNLSRLNSSSKEILVTWWLWGKLVNDVLAAIVQSKGAFGEKRRTLKAHLKTPQKNSVEVQERPTYQYELPHIDNYNKSGGKDVGADNHLGVLKAVDQAVWRLIINHCIGIIDLIINCSPEVEDEKELESSGEVAKGCVHWNGHLRRIILMNLMTMKTLMNRVKFLQ